MDMAVSMTGKAVNLGFEFCSWSSVLLRDAMLAPFLRYSGLTHLIAMIFCISKTELSGYRKHCLCDSKCSRFSRTFVTDG